RMTTQWQRPFGNSAFVLRISFVIGGSFGVIRHLFYASHMTSADEAAFLARVCEQPDDDGPRLIFADYLDEAGDPRGAFIRLHCALANLPPDDPRRPELEDKEQALLARHYDAWPAP